MRLSILIVGAVLVSLAPAEQPKPAIPADAIAFVSLDVAKVWDHPSFGAAREARGKVELAFAVQSLLGVGPADLQRVTLFWHPAAQDEPFAIITGRKNLDAKKIARLLTREKPVEPKGKAIPAPGSAFPYLLQLDAKTILLAPPAADPAKLDSLAGMPGRLAKAIDDAGNHTLTAALDVATIAALPLPVGGPLLQSESAVLTADLGEMDAATARLTLTFADEAAAKIAAPFLETKLGELAGWCAAQEKRSSDRGQNPAGGYSAPLLEWSAQTLKSAKVKADGKSVIASAEWKVEEAIGALVTAAPNAVLVSRGGSTAAENNMKQIVLGIFKYSDTMGSMPNNIHDKDGKPILSWRVQILPFIGQANLYQRFKLDEPWDSENNKALSQSVIKVYQVPGRPAMQPWETYFRGFIGPKDVKPEHRPWLVNDPKNAAKFPASFSDGTANTWLVVEAEEAVPWAKPDDLPYDGVLPLPKLGGPGGTYIAGFADGSVRTFRRGQIADTYVRRLISIADGEVINIPDR
jgi:hypothetical protein